jgi:hypothetical protein
MIIKMYRKYVTERRRLYIDYKCWLEELEKLTDIQVTVFPSTPDNPISLTTGYTDVSQKELVFFAAGGVAGTTYTLAVVVRTDAGQIKRDDIGLKVI